MPASNSRPRIAFWKPSKCCKKIPIITEAPCCLVQYKWNNTFHDMGNYLLLLLHSVSLANMFGCLLLQMIYSLRLEAVTMEQTTKMLTMKTRCSLLHHRPTAPRLSCLLLHVIYSLRSEAVTMEQTTKMLTTRQTPMQILVQRSAREGTIWLCYMCQLHWPSQFQQCWWRQRQNNAWSVSRSHFGWISLLKFFFPLGQ